MCPPRGGAKATLLRRHRLRMRRSIRAKCTAQARQRNKPQGDTLPVVVERRWHYGECVHKWRGRIASLCGRRQGVSAPLADALPSITFEKIVLSSRARLDRLGFINYSRPVVKKHFIGMSSSRRFYSWHLNIDVEPDNKPPVPQAIYNMRPDRHTYCDNDDYMACTWLEPAGHTTDGVAIGDCPVDEKPAVCDMLHKLMCLDHAMDGGGDQAHSCPSSADMFTALTGTDPWPSHPCSPRRLAQCMRTCHRRYMEDVTGVYEEHRDTMCPILLQYASSNNADRWCKVPSGNRFSMKYYNAMLEYEHSERLNFTSLLRSRLNVQDCTNNCTNTAMHKQLCIHGLPEGARDRIQHKLTNGNEHSLCNLKRLANSTCMGHLTEGAWPRVSEKQLTYFFVEEAFDCYTDWRDRCDGERWAQVAPRQFMLTTDVPYNATEHMRVAREMGHLCFYFYPWLPNDTAQSVAGRPASHWWLWCREPCRALKLSRLREDIWLRHGDRELRPAIADYFAQMCIADCLWRLVTLYGCTNKGWTEYEQYRQTAAYAKPDITAFAMPDMPVAFVRMAHEMFKFAVVHIEKLIPLGVGK